jgi:hypothetical protein
VWRIAIFAARAFVCIGSILFSDLLRAWARLDPLSASLNDLHCDSCRRLAATLFAAVAHPTGWLSGFRLDGRGFRFPGPIPRI